MMVKLADYLYADEAECVQSLLDNIEWSHKRAETVTTKAVDLVRNLRKQKRKMGELEVFMRQYSLDTEEGLALMCLAEALLRVPDKKTANDLIKDKVAANDWLDNIGGTNDWMVKAAGFGLSLSSATLKSMVAKMGEPVIREAMVQAMRIMGSQFVLGRTIEEAFKRAKDFPQYRMSYDMLGEGARTAKDAARYFEAYKDAIHYVGKNIDRTSKMRTPGISVKLSALHPRYEYAKKELCIPALTEKLLELCTISKSYNMALTVDAEESERLEISLKIIENVLSNKQFQGWDGFGLAIQGYQKRCFHLIEHLADKARSHKQKLQVRLVKGAYWDTEIKHCQVEGFEGYPVYTRKVNTDLSYLACAQAMLKHGDVFYSMFATHNAHTIAGILETAKDYPNSDYEFQRLHGMGEGLYDIIMSENPELKVSVYAPVGPHSDLLAYLVRRLLENGANSSFVNKIMDEDVPPEDIVFDPVKNAREHNSKVHTGIPLPEDIFPGRKNSRGVDLNDETTANEIIEGIASFKSNTHSIASLIEVDGKITHKESHSVISPTDKMHKLGEVAFLDTSMVDPVFKTAAKGFEAWSNTDADIRADALERLGDLLEEHHIELMALCVHEAGKTILDAHLEIREAVDFCRYYAQQGRGVFDKEGHAMPGPTGESNILFNQGRGTFVCISPWNFPLAIFTGQITAALMAGNAVLAKPAEQTCIVAHHVVQLMYKAGIPTDVLQLIMGEGDIGAALVSHTDVAGVAFTGSTEVAKIIQKTLADKDGPIVPLIAETGGQNAMIVDSSALPEQVIDDVVLSAFGSCGQRCSALRILYIQDDVADKVLDMLDGAMQELSVDHPEKLSTDIGAVIDKDALIILEKHRKKLESLGTKIAETPLNQNMKDQGYYFAPCAFEINSIHDLEREVFGPILHVIRFKASDIDKVIDDINATGYGLTLGVHSRIESFQEKIARRCKVGNAYVNRSMTGAVVGSQPFGGQGLSGTGPKAGGPNYLHAFATEKAISIDTTAAGGNTSLVSLDE